MGRDGPWIGGKLTERPSRIFQRHVKVSPYPEDDVPWIVEQFGTEVVRYVSAYRPSRNGCDVAGEVCDGFLFHPFTTDKYLREVTVPALLRGRAKVGATDLAGFTTSGPAFACVGRNEEEMATAIAGTKNQIAFYASTPAYRPVLDMHGWGELQTELGRLTKAGRWAELGDVIDDDVLHAFAVVGEPAVVGRGLQARWGSVATRITLYATYKSDPAMWAEVIEAIRA